MALGYPMVAAFLWRCARIHAGASRAAPGLGAAGRMSPAPTTFDAVAALVGLTLTPGQRPGVVRFLAIARDMAAVVEAVPLDEDASTWRRSTGCPIRTRGR